MIEHVLDPESLISDPTAVPESDLELVKGSWDCWLVELDPMTGNRYEDEWFLIPEQA